MQKKIKVFLCDGNRLFREGVRKLLEVAKDIQVIGEAGEGGEALKKIRRAGPDVVLMDINPPKIDGAHITGRIKKEYPRIKVIILTVQDDRPHIFEAIKSGAVGYLLKDVSSAELIETIRKVARGEALLEPKIAAKVLDEFKALSQRKKSTDAKAYTELTTRENEVLRWVALGASNREIAAKLGLSEKTVKNHLINIFQKLHVNNRTQAALFVFREKKV